MPITITALSENISEDSRLCADFGLSLHIQTDRRSIILDTGSSGKCFDNSETLGIDLSRTDAVVLSHGHFDHTDGILRLTENNSLNAPLYFSRYMFCERYWKKKDNGEYYFPTMSGLSPQYLQRKHIPFIGICEDVFKPFPDEEIYILSNIERTCPFEEICPDDVIKVNNEFVTDDYRDECILAVDNGDGIIVMTGCGHHGVINICTYVQKMLKNPVKAFIGGTHLVAFDFDRTEKTIAALKKSPLKLLAAGHCTGPDAMEAFKELDFFVPLHTGTKINL